MTSSLAVQVAQSASLNKSLLVDRSHRKPTESYLFTAREADRHDLDSVHALGVNAFSILKTIEPLLGLYEEALFSDAAKTKDRTLQNADANAELDRVLGSFLPLLGPYLLEATTGKLIEWLVRRFRIHEFNIEVVLSLFLPYHDAPHFQKMLSILHIKGNSRFSALLPYKSTSTPLTHDALVNIMLQPTHSDFSRFIGSLLPAVLKSKSTVHRALVAFHTGVLFEFIKRAFGSRGKGKNITGDEGMIGWILVAATEPLQICAALEVERSKESLINEVVLSSYLLLSAVSHTCSLSSKTFNALLKAIISCAPRVSTKQTIRTLASVFAGQDFEVTNEKHLSKSIVKTLLQLPGVVEEIQEVFPYVGTERFVGIFGKALITRLEDTHAFDVLTSLMASPTLPEVAVKELALNLIQTYIGKTDKEDGNVPARARSILVHLQQLHPAALQSAFEVIMGDSEYTNYREALEQLLLSLSVALPTSTAGVDLDLDAVVASTSADHPVRVVAVRQLYEKLAGIEVPESERTSIQSALFARVQDSNSSVLEALYAAPTQLLLVILDRAPAYVNTLAQVLHGRSASPSKATVKAHIGFVIAHLYPALVQGDREDLAYDVIDRLLFPFLLFSKSRQKTSNIVWKLIEAGESVDGSVCRVELLAGGIDAIRWEEQKNTKGTLEQQQEDGYHNTELMARINLALASKIADNIFNSASLNKYLTTMLSKLQDINAYSCALAYLICRALLGRLSGEHLIDSAHRILTAMNIKSFEGMDEFLKGTDNLQVFLHDISLATAVVLKPNKSHTLHRLQVAILANLPTIPRPAGVTLDWLAKTTTPASGEDNRAARYVELMRNVYGLANSTATLPILSTQLIRLLFINLGDDALKFLAGIWLNADLTSTASPAEFAALRHAAAFLEAHYATQHWIDFQTVLPAILFALQHSDRRMREAASECVSALVRLSQAKKPTGIYAFDVIYGDTSADLQYLEWSDLCRYIQALHASREHLLNDSSYIRVLHQQHLATLAFEPKKESGYKQRVLCYLLSHVVGCPLAEVKISLLNSVEEVSNCVKVQMLQPVLQALSSEQTSARIVETFGTSYENFACSVLASLDETAPEHLNNKNESLWEVYLSVLRHFFRPGTATSVRLILSQKLQKVIFPALQLERKSEMCRTLLELGQQIEMANECRSVLGNVLHDVAVIIQLVTALQPLAVDEAQRANKRAKLDEAKHHERYLSLVLLAETLSSKSLPGSVELVSCLLETLNKIIHDTTSSTSDKSYMEQLLMSAIENAAVNVPSNTGRSLPTIRLDILVELIRVSDNPQTFNQALLLMATLARLSPEAVLHNVMPVFTFMGSNVFHRDDAYSFRVVQKTIDSIVPVMVSSLKESPSSPLDLYVASRAFLRIFTDAANHIPRHRRTNFFGHLVEILGPSDFLAPISMLLVDKSANRVARQSLAESSSSLSLPLSLLQHCSKDLQLNTVVEVLRESQRLIEFELQTTATVNTFLEVQLDEERNAQSGTAKRQALALLAFVAHALKHLTSSSTSFDGQQSSAELLTILLDIAVAKAERLSKAGMDNISKAAADVVRDALVVMPAGDFISGVLTVLNSGESTIQAGALDLFAQQLANITSKVRQDAKTHIIKIVESIKKLLSSPLESLRIAALHALRAITDTMSPGEEHALTGTVSVVLKGVTDPHTTLPALEVLLAQSHKLGPRLIPYFKNIVKECSVVLRSGGENEKICTHATGILQGLLSSIPNFWSSSEFLQVINLYLDTRDSSSRAQSASLSSLIKVLAKKAPSKLILTTLCDLWPSLKSEHVVPKLQGYFAILKRIIHLSDRPVISDHLRPLFTVFLESFELCASSPSVRISVEADSIAAFIELVVKLNEAAFKPLFRKTFDWAFSADRSEVDIGRRLVFCHVYMALVDYFKALVIPYMSFLLQPFGDLLQDFTTSPGSQELWLVVIQTLSKALTQDEGVFWRDDKLQRLLSPIVAQVAVAARLHDTEGKTALSDCLLAFADTLSDDTLLKTLNMDLLMHTRSEEARIRLYALTCSEALWRAHGEKFIGFSTETATFIAECAEDDNDSVAKEAHRLKNAVESVAGRIEV